jgi:dCTP deaminase
MSMLELPSDASGVLPAQWLRKAIDAGIIGSGEYKIPDANIQPASLDLRLGERAYRLRCSFLPGDETVDDRLPEFVMGEIDLRDGAILERNRPYLIPLIEDLDLPPGVRAKANPKSSTGRLDIFTRVITDGAWRFDEIARGYKGGLYLEVFSRSFTIRVASKVSLNQIRLALGSTRIDDAEIVARHRDDPLLFIDGKPVPPEDIAVAEGLFLSLDLDGSVAGYRAKKNSQLLDLTLLDHYERRDFWEEVPTERSAGVVLEPEEFYLLLSREGTRIPPDLCAEMAAYEPTSGELRTHYAGFFDPGFGHDPAGINNGTRAALEVRAHDVPFMVESRQRVCKLAFDRMLEPPAILYGPDIGSNYQSQAATLSKHFRRT